MTSFKLTLAAVAIVVASTSAFANGQFIASSAGTTDSYQMSTAGSTVAPFSIVKTETRDH
jgi:hypothetical protein